MNYYLKTTDEAALWTALEAANLAVKDGDPLEWRFTGVALDIIGTIYKQTGAMLTDEEGMQYPEMVAVEGFHANLIDDEGIEGLPTIDAPTTPYRVWAGE